MDWAVLLTALILFVVGIAFLLAGYRLFRALIPLWGFLVGFDVAVAVGRTVMHTQPLTSLTGWILAIVVGLLFAALAYAYYYVSVVVLAASVGFVLGEAIVTAVAPQPGTGTLIAGVVGAVALAVIAIALDLPKALIVALTALGGATAAVIGALLALGRVDLATLQAGATGASLAVIRSSWWLTLLTLALALLGMAVQAGRLRAAPYTHAYALRRGYSRPWQRPRTRTTATTATTATSAPTAYDETTGRMPPPATVV